MTSCYKKFTLIYFLVNCQLMKYKLEHHKEYQMETRLGSILRHSALVKNVECPLAEKK